MSPRVSTRLLARQSDRRLLELLSQGHERAFEVIVLRYRPELLSYCRRLGLSDSRAEDALQHALLKAWLALQGGTEVRELRAWLYRVVHNTAVNVIRSSPEERALDLDAALIEAATVPESELERSTAAREALTHVAALPPMQRHAMLLSAVEGCTHEEVASALGITHVAVRGLLYRARVTLRAAAAALTPAPLIGWGAQASSRLAGSADGLAQLGAAGGSADLGGMLLKGAAVTVTAALAAGAVLGPLHGHHAHARPRSAPASALASAGSPVAAAAATGAPALSAARGASSEAQGAKRTTLSPSRTGLVRARTYGTPVARISPRRSVGAAPQRRSLTLAAAPVAGRAPSGGDAASSASAPSGSAGGAGGGGEAVAEAGGGGTTPGGSEGAPTPPETGGGGGEHKTEDGGAGEREAASEKSEREAEAARERSEREAEAAREKSEREAEAARELREAEAGH